MSKSTCHGFFLKEWVIVFQSIHSRSKSPLLKLCDKLWGANGSRVLFFSLTPSQLSYFGSFQGALKGAQPLAPSRACQPTPHSLQLQHQLLICIIQISKFKSSAAAKQKSTNEHLSKNKKPSRKHVTHLIPNRLPAE